MAKYWKSLKEDIPLVVQNNASHVNRAKNKTNGIENIFDENTANQSTSRRDFLKLFGFSIASATVISSCEQQMQKAIPYLNRPKEVTPGKANYYASTFYDGEEYCPIVVKVRDGRPIKIEGNELSSITRGGTSARAQASVLSLYDDTRYKVPTIDGKESTWDQIDVEIKEKLKQAAAEAKETVLLTPSIISPSTKAAIKNFLDALPLSTHVQYDIVSSSGMLEANKQCFGKRVVPSYDFSRSKYTLSFGADFLGTWLSPVEFTKQYSSSKSLTEGQKSISKHVQFESNMSLTGSNADERVLIKPSEEKILLSNLYKELAAALGKTWYPCPKPSVNMEPFAKNLLLNRGKSLVISGSNDKNAQIIVNAINLLLGNYNSTIDLDNPLLLRQGDDSDVVNLMESLKKDKVGTILFMGVNPLYDLSFGKEFAERIKKVKTRISLNISLNETSEICNYNCPDHHYLESWNDYEAKPGQYTIAQPTINPLFNTRQAPESLLEWSGRSGAYHEFIKNNWENTLYSNSIAASFFNFWTQSLRDGVYHTKVQQANSDVTYLPEKILANALAQFEEKKQGLELSFYEKVSIGGGSSANNPWLQENPDPVSKVTWDNYVCISPKHSEDSGLDTGDIVVINDKYVLPVFVQPGQANETLSIALGYGREVAGKVAKGVGENVFGLVEWKDGFRQYYTIIDKLQPTGKKHTLAQTQTHHSMEGRAIIRETSIKEYQKDPSSGNEKHEEIEDLHTSMYVKYDYPGHHWGMAIDLNKCTGCSACTIACSAENNVPVVGKKEVERAHEMHWIRIDRYYNGDAENPRTVRQPVMCQHCDNAPCENVCPVAATNHSDEGINQMAYNRCIGTRYCNNNCPYKVRRFNWFDYTTADAIKNNTYDPAGMTVDLKRMVLNPDVTVRSKGVIEKCSFCIQRIQEKKLTAKLDKRKLEDGEVKTACQQACPADAIVFGDLNDPKSKVSQYYKDPRNYHLLEELHTLPSVGYLTKVTHTESKA